MSPRRNSTPAGRSSASLSVENADPLAVLEKALIEQASQIARAARDEIDGIIAFIGRSIPAVP